MTLRDTHERALPFHTAQTAEDYLVYLKHVALYEFVKPNCAGKRVLDLGCGEGYGVAALASVARWVVAADYSFDAVMHACQKYARANAVFVVCDAQHLPFANDCFDTAISFEVIEHIPDVPRYLQEIKRIGVAHGQAIISTPNRLLRLLPFQKPWNRFHLREYDAPGLARTIGAVFSQVQILGITAIPAILEIEKQRVKQNPFVAYPKMLAQMLLPSGVYDRLKRVKPNTDTPAVQSTIPPMPNNFTASDYAISSNGLRESINLIAVGKFE